MFFVLFYVLGIIGKNGANVEGAAAIGEIAGKKALEAGIFTATTKDRITELELQIDELNGRILSEECKEANLLTREDVETFLMDALKAEPQLLIDTLIDKIILFDDKVEIFYKYSQNNNPDEISQEIRRDFCLPSGKRVAVTPRHIILTIGLGSHDIDIFFGKCTTECTPRQLNP